MASKAFNLVAKLQIQGPVGLPNVLAKARKQLRGGLKANINLKFNKNTNRQLNTLHKNLVKIEATLLSIAPAASRAAASMSSLATSVSKVSSASATTSTNVSGLAKQAQSAATSFGKINSSTTATVKGLNNISKSAKSASNNVGIAKTQMEEFGRISALAIRRFAGFSIATGVIFGFIRSVTGAVSEAIKFEKELIKVGQVTKRSIGSLTDLTGEVTRLSTTMGVASQELITVSRTLAQAGFTARETKVALEALAKSSLAPTFRDIAQTTEGAIAALKQFQLQTSSLDDVLGSVNAVAGRFAVEAEDIIGAVRRSGGVFAAAAGDLSKFSEAAKVEKFQEFISLFTSVRATTRESAETIATGLRTIFTRIQRGSTISQLRELGIELQDSEGQFIGVFNAVEQLSKGLKALPATDQRFNRIIEELGGFRQVGKVIPLINQFSTAQNALAVAQAGVGSTTADALLAQKGLANQIAKVREEFAALMREMTNTGSFRSIIGLVLKTASSLITFADSIKPILPILALFGAIRGAQALTGFGKGFFGGLKSNAIQGAGVGATLGAGVAGGGASAAVTGGNTTAISANTAALSKLSAALVTFGRARFPGLKFNTGGQVPGVGNTDSVPADLTPGEFVIRKSVVKQVGAENLANLNRGGRVGFAKGGMAQGNGKINLTGRGNAQGDVGRKKQYLAQYVQLLKEGQAQGLLSPEEERTLRSKSAKLASIGQSRSRRFHNRHQLNSGGRVGFATGGGAQRPFDFGVGSKFPAHLTDEQVLAKGGSQARGEFNRRRDRRAERTEAASALQFGVVALRGKQQAKQELDDVTYNTTDEQGKRVKTKQPILIRRGKLGEDFADKVKKTLTTRMGRTITGLAHQISSTFGVPVVEKDVNKLAGATDLPAMIGHLFEGSLRGLGGGFDRNEVTSDLDFPKGLSPALSQIFKVPSGIPSEGANVSKSPAQIKSKIKNYLESGGRAETRTQTGQRLRRELPEEKRASIRADRKRLKRNEGGGTPASSDTVPALLTPGEFVFNKTAAKSIGHSNLERLNSGNVQGFANGGIVGGRQKFATGGGVSADDFTIEMRKFLASMKKAGASLEERAGAFKAGQRNYTRTGNVDSASLAATQAAAAGRTEKVGRGRTPSRASAARTAASVKKRNAAATALAAQLRKEAAASGKSITLVDALNKARAQNAKALKEAAATTVANARSGGGFAGPGGPKLGRFARIKKGVKENFGKGALGLAFVAPQLASGIAGDDPNPGVAAGAAAFSGAVTGGLAGFSVGGPWGAAVGGAIGAVTSATSAWQAANVGVAAAALANATDIATLQLEAFVKDDNISKLNTALIAQIAATREVQNQEQDQKNGVIGSIARNFFGASQENQDSLGAKGFGGIIGDYFKTGDFLTAGFGGSLAALGGPDINDLLSQIGFTSRDKIKEEDTKVNTALRETRARDLLARNQSAVQSAFSSTGSQFERGKIDEAGLDAAFSSGPLAQVLNDLRAVEGGGIGGAQTKILEDVIAGEKERLITEKKLREALEASAVALDNFIQKLARSAATIATATSSITRSVQQITNDAAQIFSPATLGKSAPVEDIFANPLAHSADDLVRAFDGLSTAVGIDGTEFGDTIKTSLGALRGLQDTLPKILAKAGGEADRLNSENPVRDIIANVKGSQDFKDLPKQLQTILIGKLESQLTSRKSKLGPGQIAKELSREDLLKSLLGGSKEQISKSISEIVKQFNTLNSAYEKGLNSIIQTNIKIAAMQDGVLQLQAKNLVSNNKFAASPRALTLGELTAGSDAQLQRQASRGGAASTGVEDLRSQLFSLLDERNDLQEQRQGLAGGTGGAAIAALEELSTQEAAVIQKLDATNKALGQVKDSTEKLAAIQEKFRQLEERKAGVKDVAEQLAFGSPEEIAELTRKLELGVQALQTGRFPRGPAGADARDGIRLVGQLDPQGELGRRARQRENQLLARTPFGGAIIPGLGGDTPGDILQGSDEASQDLRETLLATTQSQERAAAVQLEAAEVARKNGDAQGKLIKGLQSFAARFGLAVDDFRGLDRLPAEGAPPEPPGFAKGGYVPGRGNKDTVAAQLTPGEFVMKKSVTKKHAGFLSALNSGAIKGYAKGGEVEDEEIFASIAKEQQRKRLLREKVRREKEINSRKEETFTFGDGAAQEETFDSIAREQRRKKVLRKKIADEKEAKSIREEHGVQGRTFDSPLDKFKFGAIKAKRQQDRFAAADEARRKNVERINAANETRLDALFSPDGDGSVPKEEVIFKELPGAAAGRKRFQEIKAKQKRERAEKLQAKSDAAAKKAHQEALTRRAFADPRAGQTQVTNLINDFFRRAGPGDRAGGRIIPFPPNPPQNVPGGTTGGQPFNPADGARFGGGQNLGKKTGPNTFGGEATPLPLNGDDLPSIKDVLNSTGLKPGGFGGGGSFGGDSQFDLIIEREQEEQKKSDARARNRQRINENLGKLAPRPEVGAPPEPFLKSNTQPSEPIEITSKSPGLSARERGIRARREKVVADRNKRADRRKAEREEKRKAEGGGGGAPLGGGLPVARPESSINGSTERSRSIADIAGAELPPGLAGVREAHKRRLQLERDGPGINFDTIKATREARDRREGRGKFSPENILKRDQKAVDKRAAARRGELTKKEEQFNFDRGIDISSDEGLARATRNKREAQIRKEYDRVSRNADRLIKNPDDAKAHKFFGREETLDKLENGTLSSQHINNKPQLGKDNNESSIRDAVNKAREALGKPLLPKKIQFGNHGGGGFFALGGEVKPQHFAGGGEVKSPQVKRKDKMRELLSSIGIDAAGKTIAQVKAELNAARGSFPDGQIDRVGRRVQGILDINQGRTGDEVQLNNSNRLTTTTDRQRAAGRASESQERKRGSFKSDADFKRAIESAGREELRDSNVTNKQAKRDGFEGGIKFKKKLEAGYKESLRSNNEFDTQKKRTSFEDGISFKKSLESGYKESLRDNNEFDTQKKRIAFEDDISFKKSLQSGYQQALQGNNVDSKKQKRDANEGRGVFLRNQTPLDAENRRHANTINKKAQRENFEDSANFKAGFNPLFQQDLRDANEAKRKLNSGKGNLQFAGGGGVPGFGVGDTVPAMLTPGEFVINKKSAQKNMSLLKALNNGQRFANGGQVQGAGASAGISVAAPEMKVPAQFTSALTAFSSAATTLAPSLESFSSAVSSLNAAADKLSNISLPSSIDINFGGSPIQVVVSVNGAEALAGMDSSLKEMISSKVNVEIRKHIDFTGATKETIG